MSICDNMSGSSIHHMDSIKIDDDWSQGLLTSVNIRSEPSMSQARGARGHGGTTQNKYVSFFFHMDEKSDIDIELNDVVVTKISNILIDQRITFTI